MRPPFRYAVFDKLDLSSLHREVPLSKGNLFLAWISILSDQVAGKPREHEVINWTFGSTPNPDHFRDATKMVVRVRFNQYVRDAK